MSRWRYWVSVLFLLNAMQALGVFDKLVYGDWLGKPGNKITQSVQLLMILTSSTLFIDFYRRARRLSTGAILALLVIGYLFLTTFWSADPGGTLKESVVYLFVMLGMIGVAGSFEADEYLDLLRMSCFISALASLALLVFWPSKALMWDGGGMEGIFAHKNVLGQTMATGFFACIHSLRASGRDRNGKILMALTFAGVAAASRSATALLTIFVFFGADRLIALYRKGGSARTAAAFATAILVPILLIVAFDPDPLLELIGKDPTLTGRTEIWAFVTDDIAQKPFLGWGYFGFWVVDNPAAREIGDTLKWFVPQAHNGLLEMLLQIGFFGTGLFLLIFVRNLVFAVQSLKGSARDLAISTILYYIGILMLGVSETVLLAPTQSSTTVFFITGLMCERVLARSKQRRYRSARSRYPRPAPEGSPTRTFGPKP